MMGWGRTNNFRGDQGDKREGGAFQKILQKLQLPHIPYSKCKSNWPAFRQISDDKQICAGGEQGKNYLVCTIQLNT